MPDGYDLIDHIAALSPLPLMLIHGTRDEIVPFENGEALFAAASEPKSFLRYAGPHIGTFRDLELRELVLDFFARSAASPAMLEAIHCMATDLTGPQRISENPRVEG